MGGCGWLHEKKVVEENSNRIMVMSMLSNG